MKMLILAMSFLVMSFAQAQETPGCGGAYAAGLGHMMKGVSTSFTNSELIPVGKTAKDKFFKAKVTSVNGVTQVELWNNRTKKKEKITRSSFDNNMSVFATDNLMDSPDYPENVPGQIGGKIFLIFFCIN